MPVNRNALIRYRTFRLEDKIYTSKHKQETRIDFEKNDNLKGPDYLDPLYRAVQGKQTLRVTYQSFKAQAAAEFLFHPYYLPAPGRSG